MFLVRDTFHRKYRNQEQNKENLNGSINGRKVQRTPGHIIQEEKQSGQHQEKRQKSVAGEAAGDQQFCKHSGGSHWRNQCIQSDGACRQRSRRSSGGICHLCSQGSRSGDQRAESAGTENGGT